MKSFNKTLFALGLVAMSGAILTSCNKTVTAKKVDGDWDVTSGSMETTYTEEDYESTSSSSFNGTTITTTTTTKVGNQSETDGSTSDMTISYTFDRKAGTYSTTQVGTSEEVDNYFSYYVYVDSVTPGYYTYEGFAERVATRESTSMENGLFTINGEAGDEIEANSQIVFIEEGGSESFTETYTYYDEDGDELDRSDIYEQGEYDPVTGEYDYDKPASGAEGSNSYTGSSSGGVIWTVVEMTKTEMTVEWSDATVYVDADDSDNNYTSETSVSWTLTAK